MMKIHPSVDKAEKHFLPSGSSVIHSSGGNRQKKKVKYTIRKKYTHILNTCICIYEQLLVTYICVYIYIYYIKNIEDESQNFKEVKKQAMKLHKGRTF